MAPPPGALEGVKGLISLNFNYKVNFKEFKQNQTLCVFSQMKDIKHIRRDSFGRLGHASGVVPQWGGGGGGGGLKQSFSEIQPDLVCELLT